MWCIINLPNGTQQAVKWDPKAIGQECLEKVCKALGIICEMEYFGLEHWTPNQNESRSRQWINLRNRLSCDSNSSSGIQLMLALRVKFWVPVHFILQESVRNLFYMQARVDLLEGRLKARDWTNAAKLAALLCQADGIRFNKFALKAECPIRMRQEHELTKLQEQQQMIQQQQQLQAQHLHTQRKEKEYVLSFKKRRLSKQKSFEYMEHPMFAQSQLNQTSGQLTPSPSETMHHLTTTLTAPTSLSNPNVASDSALGTNNKITTTVPEISARSSNLRSFSVSLSAVAQDLSNATCSSISRRTSKPSSVALEDQLALSPLRVYQEYILRPASQYESDLPHDFLRQIAVEHSKLAKLNMTQKSAKYWLLQEIQDLSGYGEEVFSGVTTNENSIRCDIAVGAHGLTVCHDNCSDEQYSIPFSAIAAAKSFRRTFKLEYLNDHNERKDLEIKLPKHAIAAGLYRSITERHAFYVCDKVRGVVTNQFTRDLKGTIASMFNEDTELGKRYVFDIQHTCREVHDQARRILHERGIEISSHRIGTDIVIESDDIANYLPTSSTLPSYNNAIGAVGFKDTVLNTAIIDMSIGASCSNGLSLGATCSMAGKLDLAIREKEAREAAIERCVDTRISEAMTCKICMDRTINTMFSPCCHVIACAPCAARCKTCPNCRVKVTSVVKIYLPPELRTSQSDGSELNCGNKDSPSADSNFVDDYDASLTTAVSIAESTDANVTTPKISSAA